MDFLDIKTIIFSNIISSVACAFIIYFLWRQNHARCRGLGFWLAYSCLQLLGEFLIALRGFIPDFISIIAANAFLMFGVMLLYLGLERFIGIRVAQIQNYVILGVFILVHAYFTYATPNLNARNINISIGMLVFCAQAAWLMMVRSENEMRKVTFASGIIFVIFCLISIGRVVIEIILPPENNFLNAGVFNNLALLLYQILSVVLAFSLFLMVNRKLLLEQAGEISERARAERLIQISLNEKEVLLRELYHRTKNNMQVISSMLVLEAGKRGNDELSRIFRDMDGRIRSMALVHQKLYQSGNLSSLDLGEYVRELVALITDMHKDTHERVTVSYECQSIPILIDSAVPLGLIVNEIISNSLKYAFPGDRRGEIRIQLSKIESGAIRLSIADNGRGIEPSRDLHKSETLGMQIIFGIARHQLGAKVEYETGEGLIWRIEFTDNRYKPRVEA